MPRVEKDSTEDLNQLTLFQETYKRTKPRGIKYQRMALIYIKWNVIAVFWITTGSLLNSLDVKRVNNIIFMREFPKIKIERINIYTKVYVYKLVVVPILFHRRRHDCVRP
jgi:hypothetical protein